MWGLEIQILYFVPEENPELANEDRFRMSKGMEAFLLNHHNFNVKPGMMVTKRIIETAALVYECDRSVDKHASPCAMQLRTLREYLTLMLKIGICLNSLPRSS
jgi:hypothetical protein